MSAGGFERRVALKVMHQHLANDEKFRSMFLDEARLAARIHHPNVVGTIDVIHDAGTMMLVMDYVAGLTLRALMRGAQSSGVRIPPGVAAAIISDMLAGLHAAHELEDADGHPLCLVHRDMSPDNALVGSDGITRISDFGVARANARLVSTDVNAIKGNVAYMAPEQARCQDLDRTADIYAAGVMLWELLAGRRLHDGETEWAILGAVLSAQIPSPSEVAPGVPPALAAACMRALCRDPTQRYADAAAFAEAIEAAAQSSGVRVASARELSRFVRAIESGEDVQLSESLYPRSVQQPATARTRPLTGAATLECEQTPRSSNLASLSPLSAPYPQVPDTPRRNHAAALAVVMGVCVGAFVSLIMIPQWQGKFLGNVTAALAPTAAVMVSSAASATTELRPALTFQHPSAAALKRPSQNRGRRGRGQR